MQIEEVGRGVGVEKLWHKGHEEGTKDHKVILYDIPGLPIPIAIGTIGRAGIC
jgi:hypothetical protein